MFKIKQYVSQESCLSCLGCCRYSCNPSIWSPNLLEEERLLSADKLNLVVSGESYICGSLNSKDNICRIYNQRPLECRLYPLLINNSNEQIYLSIDLNCPVIGQNTDSKELKRYVDYILGYLRGPEIALVLSKNRRFFSSYPTDKIINLEKLDI